MAFEPSRFLEMTYVAKAMRQVLDQRPAPSDVEHLHAPANAEDWEVGIKGSLHQPQLSLIAARVDARCLGFTLGTVERRVDVAAADKNDRVERA